MLYAIRASELSVDAAPGAAPVPPCAGGAGGEAAAAPNVRPAAGAVVLATAVDAPEALCSDCVSTEQPGDHHAREKSALDSTATRSSAATPTPRGGRRRRIRR